MTYAEKVQALEESLGSDRREEDEIRFRIRGYDSFVEISLDDAHPTQLLGRLHETVARNFGSDGVARFAVRRRMINVVVRRDGEAVFHRVDAIGPAAQDVLLKAYAYEQTL
jgi:hypothetical protein